MRDFLQNSSIFNVLFWRGDGPDRASVYVMYRPRSSSLRNRSTAALPDRSCSFIIKSIRSRRGGGSSVHRQGRHRLSVFMLIIWRQTISASQIWSSGSFEERLFPEALLSLFLSGGMIFISHLLRSLYYSSLNQHCIICLDHLHLILLRHIIADIERWLIFRSFYVSICSVRKISLIYITSIRISS